MSEPPGPLHPPFHNSQVPLPTSVLFFKLTLLGINSSLIVSPGLLFCWQGGAQWSTDGNITLLFWFPYAAADGIFWCSSLPQRATSRNYIMWATVYCKTVTFSFILGLMENCDALLTATLTLHSVDTSHEGSGGGQHPTRSRVPGATLAPIQEGLG